MSNFFYTLPDNSSNITINFDDLIEDGFSLIDEHFLSNGASGGVMHFINVAQTSGTISAIQGEPGAMGLVEFRIAAQLNSRAGAVLNPSMMASFFDAPSETAIYYRLKPTSFSVVGNSYFFRFGLTNDVTTPIGGLYHIGFVYDPQNGGGFNPGNIANWIGFTKDNATVVIADTGVVPDIVNYTLFKIRLENATGDVKFYINNTLVATIPAISVPVMSSLVEKISIGHLLRRVIGAGASNQTINIDRVVVLRK